MNEPTLTLRAIDFIRCNWGSLASVVGLVFSGLAAFFGKRDVTRKLSAAPAESTTKQLLRIQITYGKIQDIFIEEHASAMKRNDGGGR